MTDEELKQLIDRADSLFVSMVSHSLQVMGECDSWLNLREQIYQEISRRKGNPNLQAETQHLGFQGPQVEGIRQANGKALEPIRAERPDIFTIQ